MNADALSLPELSCFLCMDRDHCPIVDLGLICFLQDSTGAQKDQFKFDYFLPSANHLFDICSQCKNSVIENEKSIVDFMIIF